MPESYDWFPTPTSLTGINKGKTKLPRKPPKEEVKECKDNVRSLVLHTFSLVSGPGEGVWGCW